MQLKNIDKNLVGNIVIIISIIVVVVSIAMIITASGERTHLGTAEWDGQKYFIEPDSDFTTTDDSLIVTSSFNAHNIQLKKTKDLTNYKKNIDASGVMKLPHNATHVFVLNPMMNYGAVVPIDSLGSKFSDIQGSPEIIEVTGGDSDYMISFMASATSV